MACLFPNFRNRTSRDRVQRSVLAFELRVATTIACAGLNLRGERLLYHKKLEQYCWMRQPDGFSSIGLAKGRIARLPLTHHRRIWRRGRLRVNAPPDHWSRTSAIEASGRGQRRCKPVWSGPARGSTKAI